MLQGERRREEELIVEASWLVVEWSWLLHSNNGGCKMNLASGGEVGADKEERRGERERRE